MHMNTVFLVINHLVDTVLQTNIFFGRFRLKAGQAFVHDPKSIGSNIVKAQVKLRFTNK